MSKVWCAWEESYFDASDFEKYNGGRLRHKDQTPSHASDGLIIGSDAGPVPMPGRDNATPRNEPPVMYGNGPMARPR